MKTGKFWKRVRQVTLAVALLNIVAAGVFATAAADAFGPDDRVEIRPADTAYGDNYTSIDNGQLEIQVKRLNRQAVTKIPDLFVIENEYNEPARVHIQHDQADKVTFYDVSSGASISGSENNVTLQSGENISVGMEADTTSGVINLNNITFSARAPDIGSEGGGGGGGSGGISNPGPSEPSVTVDQSNSQSGQVDATVSNVQPGGSVTINLFSASDDSPTEPPESVENATNVSAAASTVPGLLTSIDAEYLTGGTSLFSVTANDEPTQPLSEGMVSTTSYTIERSGDAQMTKATLRLSVDKEVAHRRGIDLSSGRVLKAPTPDSGWQALPTEQVEPTENTYVFEAETQDFSEFTLVFDELNVVGSQLTVPATVSPDRDVPITGQVTNNQPQSADVQLNVTGADGTVYSDTVTVEPNTTVDLTRSIRLQPGEYTVSLGSESQTVTVTQQPVTETPTSVATPTETGTPTEIPTVVQREVSPDIFVMALLVSGFLLGLLALRRYSTR